MSPSHQKSPSAFPSLFKIKSTLLAAVQIHGCDTNPSPTYPKALPWLPSYLISFLVQIPPGPLHLLLSLPILLPGTQLLQSVLGLTLPFRRHFSQNLSEVTSSRSPISYYVCVCSSFCLFTCNLNIRLHRDLVLPLHGPPSHSLVQPTFQSQFISSIEAI